jgi:hypothetical protein
MKKICRNNFFHLFREKKGIWFHLIGIISVIWFAIRVLPAPHRSQYPCQQVGIPIALGYITFWSVLIFGFITWVKSVQRKTIAVAPALLMVFILLFSITGFGFATVSYPGSLSYQSWDFTPNQPMGSPTGMFPGRVVWIWDPNATETNLDGYWWEPQNNDPDVINTMFSQGLKVYTNTSSEKEAWDLLFTHFNIYNDRGTSGYNPGEKIAIKVNLNNCWNYLNYIDDYKTRDNERDAHPELVKIVLNHLINIIGVAPSMITVYDASRPMPDWFFNPVSSAFPDVIYVDNVGKDGRTIVQSSSTKFYFSDGVIRTLPTCVTEADYLINMPIMKQHPINHGVTLSGKNLFGTFIEPVWDIHPYHESGQIVGNPAPQVDLFASEDLGGKTLLYIGDGLYSTLYDHRTIFHFQMEPFFDDWTNSLFISQDPIAIDSVMYDFLHTEGPIPIEGSQNYLHQSAVPDQNVYDPENDDIFLSESIGVHEHWNTSVPIFRSERYVGVAQNGIDFIILSDQTEPSTSITIEKPAYQHLYIQDIAQNFTILWMDFYTFPTTIVVGPITIKTVTSPIYHMIDHVDFSIDGTIQYSDEEPTYEWIWDTVTFGYHQLTVTASYNDEVLCSAERTILKIF